MSSISYGKILDLFKGNRVSKNFTVIIMGRPGPTGKTHLYYLLKKQGFNAIELSENLGGLVDYIDDKNHYEIDYMNQLVIIILNKRLNKEDK